MNRYYVIKNSVEMWEVRMLITELETDRIIQMFNTEAEALQYSKWLENRLEKVINEELIK